MGFKITEHLQLDNLTLKQQHKIMALKLNIKAENNFGTLQKLEDVYVKVNHVSGNKEMQIVQVNYSVNNKSIFEKTFSHLMDLNGENPIKQAYLHLKTLPEFADAVDC